MDTVAVIGAGTMGHGIAQVCAMAGCEVRLTDANAAALPAAVDRIGSHLQGGVDRGKLTVEDRDAALSRIRTKTTIAAASAGADLVVEAVPEILELKIAILSQAERAAANTAILATNTSSLSVAGMAAGLSRPERLLGMHFFNPVHIMKLLEVIHHAGTDPAVLETVKTFGERLGKEVIVVRDVPGFATSRLGVCLGMEAIRMVEEQVASAEDIDKAMVLGYRHPIGPLKLTDLVGLDVRMKIGEYLARELQNPAFKPPELMKRMVAEGKLGKKSGRGFYDWGE